KAGEKIDISVRATRKGDKKPMEGVSLALFSPPDNARTIAVTDKQGYAYFSVTKTDMGSGNKKFSVVIDPGYKNESDVFSGGKEFYINILPADNRKSVNIDVHDVIVNFGEKALFGATAKSGRDLLVKDAKLGFSIYRMDGVLTKYCEAVTNNSGIGECSVWAFVPAAKYNIEVLYNGLNTDNGYLPAKGKGVLTVNKAYRPIEATYDVTTKPFTLIIGMDNWGGPVTGETFTITLDKTQTYTRHAASDGKFWLEDKNIHEGMSVVIEFAGTYMLKPAKYTGMIQGGKLVGSSIQVTETPRSN
ncbi:MAG: hypothetical protein LWW87_06025, partial [Geobacteraceae bacterium]|nr:hypothetical protein [Geobacteraceae bacterium]